LDYYNSLHKKDKKHGIIAPENTLYYEKYQTIDLSLFLCSTQQRSTVQKLSCPYFIHIFLSSKNNKYKQIKALELNLNIFPQNRHAIYFSYKVHHIRRLTKLEPYFSEQYMIYYAFPKINNNIKNKIKLFRKVPQT
jgi:hypothetical protein